MISRTLFLGSVFFALTAFAAEEEVCLNGRWRLDGTDERGAAISCAATVPGGVFGALKAAGTIPDPVLGDNEKRVQWVGRRPWTFRRTFRLEPDFLRHRRVILRMDDVDTFADVCVNGQPVGVTSNRFRRWDFDVKPLLNVGENEIVLRFASAEQKSEELAKRLDRGYWISNVTVRHMNLIRKPACHGGWDWGPTVMETGPCGPVRLIASDGDRIDYVYHEQAFTDDLSRCTLTVFAELETGAVVTNRIAIERPPLWWPNGMGEQAFYDYDVQVCGRRLKGRVGLRRLEVSRKGGELAFVVNNRRLFARGANWIPSDVLANRETPVRKRALLASAVRANMNMVRVWGGGHFESDDFYAACDELGLLVWQDMMFACAVYPDWDDFIGEVRAEVTHQVKRLRPYASVALWCGDNECIQIPHEHRKPEDRTFHFANLARRVDVLREAISAADPTRLFWPGSPCQGENDLSMPKFDDAKGDFHCWEAAAPGERVFAPHLRRRPRFASEFGFMSRSRCDPDRHMKHPRSEKAMLDELRTFYPHPRDRADEDWLTQVAQAEALSAVTLAWRTDRPRCNGVLYWQLNDVWPATSWSTVEYDGRWKPAHYAMRRAYAPVSAALVGDEVKVVNDSGATVSGRLAVRVRALDGSVVSERETPLTVADGASVGVSAPAVAEDGFLDIRFGDVRAFAVPNDWKCLLRADSGVTAEIDGLEVTLTAKRPAFHVWCRADGLDGEFSDNDLMLLPGEPVRIRFDGRASADEFKRAFAVVHLTR